MQLCQDSTTAYAVSRGLSNMPLPFHYYEGPPNSTAAHSMAAKTILDAAQVRSHGNTSQSSAGTFHGLPLGSSNSIAWLQPV